MLSCSASAERKDNTQRFSTPEAAVKAAIADAGHTPPANLRVVFRFPNHGVHDVRLLAEWGDRSDYYGASGVERNGYIEWVASGPIEFC